MAQALTHPTVVIQAGELARAVSHRLRDRVGERLAGPAGNLALLDASADAAALQQTLDRLLSLPEIIARAGPAGPPQLHIFLLGDLAQEGVPAALSRELDRLLELARGRYAALFQAYREGAAANWHCNPVLLAPGPGQRWSPEARALVDRLQALHASAESPSVSNIFVVTEASGRYLLPREELTEVVATFLQVACTEELRSSDVLSRLLKRSGDPFATFVCATASFDDHAARRYCATHTALELMGWLRHTSEQRTDVEDRQQEVEALFDTGRLESMVPLEKGQRALSGVIDRQCPDFAAAFRDVGLLEDTEQTLAHYDDAWWREQRARLERADTELDRFRIAEVIEEVEVNGAALVASEGERLDHFIDDKLSRPSRGNVADTLLSLGHLRKRLEAERERVAPRATASLRRAPDLARFDGLYQELGQRAWDKPRRGRLLWWGLLACGVATSALALLLRNVVPILGLGPDSALRVALEPPTSWLTAALLSGTTIGSLLLLRVWRTAGAIRELVGHRGRRGSLLQTLEELSRGPDGSLAAYYGSRFRRACDNWVHRTLLAIIKQVDDRIARITELLTTLERQAKAAERALIGGAAPGAAAPQPILRRSLVDPARMATLAAERRQPRELRMVVERYFERHHPFERWERRLPFADFERIVERCQPFYPDLGAQSALVDRDLAEDARARLERFFGDLCLRLDLPLDFAAHRHADPDDVDRALDGVVIAGGQVADVVRAALDASGAGSWELVESQQTGNRVHLLRLVTDIAPSAIRWHEAAS